MTLQGSRRHVWILVAEVDLGLYCLHITGKVSAHADLRTTRILDVAHDFPHVSTVAVDLVPMQVL